MADATSEQADRGDGVQALLDQLIRTSGTGYAEISRMLGRNPAYIQQFIKRGVPRRLSEEDRRILAGHFGISESRLGAPASTAARIAPGDSRHEICAFPFILGSGKSPGSLRLDARLLPDGTDSDALAAMTVDGDAMAPAFLAGDHVLVDRSDCKQARDGIYAIDTGSAPHIRRLSVHPVTRRITVIADNAAYPSFADCDPAGIQLLGRVIWVSRALP